MCSCNPEEPEFSGDTEDPIETTTTFSVEIFIYTVTSAKPDIPVIFPEILSTQGPSSHKSYNATAVLVLIVELTMIDDSYSSDNRHLAVASWHLTL